MPDRADFKFNQAGGTLAYKRPKNLINALSEIQRYYVLESRNEDMPKEYFTLEQIFDFIKVGFKSGILEGLLFIVLLPFLQTIYPSFKFFFLAAKINDQEQLFFTLGSYVAILLSTLFMIYLSKYCKGELTRRALFALMNGRSLAFLIKGVGIYYLLHYIQNRVLKDPDAIYSWMDFIQWILDFFTRSSITTDAVYLYCYRFIIPALGDTANEILFSMMVFAFFPYLTLFYRDYAQKREAYKGQTQYKNY